MSTLGVPIEMWLVAFAPLAWCLLVTVPLLWLDTRRGYRLVRVKERPRPVAQASASSAQPEPAQAVEADAA